MTGSLTIIGLGPGAAELLTQEARTCLEDASDIIGYGPYVDRVPERAGQRKHRTDNREELGRARHALDLAQSGARVAVVSSGDPGVFAMASAVFEAVEHGAAEWRHLDIRVVPGISAMFATAAAIGAPLGHDFCAISLSDNLKPWELVLARLEAAARADFVIALYNARSNARPDHLGEAFARLRSWRAPETPVIFATAISRPEQRIDIVALRDAEPARCDMRTLVMIGSSATRLIARQNGSPWVYTPRFARSPA